VQHFDSGGVDIAYLDQGEGPPVLLIHGFASTAKINWVEPGWVDTLVRAGRRAIALDNRGHGESGKPHDPAAYTLDNMAGDARRLLDRLGIATADVMGYSMGARIAARLAMREPARVTALILGGLAGSLFAGQTNQNEIAAALEARSIGDVRGDIGFAFRDFAERTRSDLKALAACMRSETMRIDPEELAALPMPILVAVGTRDSMAGPIDAVAEKIPNAELLAIPNRDHMNAVGDRVYKEGVLAFLARHRPLSVPRKRAEI
jgi:pimeloyl-ACP methyl ester carboxylesterase